MPAERGEQGLASISDAHDAAKSHGDALKWTGSVPANGRKGSISPLSTLESSSRATAELAGDTQAHITVRQLPSRESESRKVSLLSLA